VPEVEIKTFHYDCPECGWMVYETISPDLYDGAFRDGLECPECGSRIPARSVHEMRCPICHSPQESYARCEKCREGFRDLLKRAWGVAEEVVEAAGRGEPLGTLMLKLLEVERTIRRVENAWIRANPLPGPSPVAEGVRPSWAIPLSVRRSLARGIVRRRGQ